MIIQEYRQVNRQAVSASWPCRGLRANGFGVCLSPPGTNQPRLTRISELLGRRN